MNQERIAWTAAEARSAIAIKDEKKLRVLLSKMKREGTMSDEMILSFVHYACEHGRVPELALILRMTREVSPLDFDWIELGMASTRGDVHPAFAVYKGHGSGEERRVMMDLLHADGRLTRRLDDAFTRWPCNNSLLEMMLTSISFGQKDILKLMSLGAYRCERIDYFLMKSRVGTAVQQQAWTISNNNFDAVVRAKYAVISSRRLVLAILYGEEATGRQVLPRELWRKVMYKL